MRRTPTQCPVCDLPLTIAELRCRGCGTTLRGEFPLSRCAFCDLPAEQLRFWSCFSAAAAICASWSGRSAFRIPR